MYRIAKRFLAGSDGPGRTAPPLGELCAPVPLLAIAVMVVNDRVLKGSGAPPWLVGKLSDFAGLAFFPLFVTAAVDSHLNEHGYIVPGLGDAGDRLYGTAG